MKRLLRTRPLLAARAAVVRSVGLLIAAALAAHALAKFLVSSHGSSQLVYLALSLAIAAAVLLVTGRPRRRSAGEAGRARGRVRR